MSNINENQLLISRAKGAVMSRDFITAIRLYKQLLAEDPSNIDYLKELGSVFIKSGDDEKAIPYFQQIITFYPHDIDAMISLGGIYRRLKRYEDSINILHRAIDEGGQSCNVNYNLGFTYKEMKNYDDAIDSFNSVISENPSDVLAYNHLGAIYLEKKDYQKSIASFRRGLQIDQNHPILNYNLARCYTEAKMYADAIRCYENVLKTRPGWIEAINDFSKLLVSCQRSKEASDLVSHSIELYPNDTKLLCLLGNIYLDQYDYDSAVQAFNKAKQVDNQSVEILSNLAKALEANEKPKEALDNVISALAIEPDNKNIKKQYVQTLLSADEIEKAGINIKELYNEDQNDLNVLDLYGQYCICAGEDEEIKQLFDKISISDKKYTEHYLSAANRYNQIGNTEKAEEMAKTYVAYEINNPDGYNMLGKIYNKSGNYQGAIESYNKSRNLKKPNILADRQINHISSKMSYVQVPEEKIAENEEATSNNENTQVEENTIVEAKEDEFDFSQMGDNIPMQEALLEEEKSFFDEIDEATGEAEVAEEEEESDLDNPSLEDIQEDDQISPFQDFEAEEPLSDKEQLLDNPEGDILPEFGDNPFTSLGDEEENSLLDNFEGNQNGDGQEEALLSDDSLEPLLGEDLGMPAAKNAENPGFMDNPYQNAPVAENNSIPADLQQKINDAAMTSANAAIETAMNAQKFAQELAEEQNRLKDQLKALEEEKAARDAVIDALENNNDTESLQDSASPENLDNDFDNMDATEAPCQEENLSENEALAEEEASLENPLAEALSNENSNTITAEKLIPTIEKILSDENAAMENYAEIEMFKKLLSLGQYLPEPEKTEFLTSRVRMQLEYLIAKLSGKPGLLQTAISLLKTGVLGENDLSLDSKEDFIASNHQLRKVLKNMKVLSHGLEDEYLSKSMCISIDNILEKIEIVEKDVQIFE